MKTTRTIFAGLFLLLTTFSFSQSGIMFWETKQLLNPAFGGIDYSKNAILGDYLNSRFRSGFYSNTLQGSFNFDETVTKGNLGVSVLHNTHSFSFFDKPRHYSSFGINYSKDVLPARETQLRVGGTLGLGVSHSHEFLNSDSSIYQSPRENYLFSTIGVAFKNDLLTAGVSGSVSSLLDVQNLALGITGYLALNEVKLGERWRFYPRAQVSLNTLNIRSEVAAGFGIGKFEFGLIMQHRYQFLSHNIDVPLYGSYNFTDKLKLGYSITPPLRYIGSSTLSQQVQLSWRISK